MNAFPGEIRTTRLLLRSWRERDARRLLPILEANIAHLQGWIPAHVAMPAPPPELERRLAGFAADFRAGRSWRFAMFSPAGRKLFGEISLFPRSAEGRVAIDAADRLEIGYWLRRDATGCGYATEACRAMLSLAAAVPGMRHVEIRCDPRNLASAAVPARLGFQVASVVRPDGMIWIHELVSPVVQSSVVADA